jgi:hypothetical protein
MVAFSAENLKSDLNNGPARDNLSTLMTFV